MLYNNKAVYLGVQAGGSCAMGGCEPCQAGNRAALSSFVHAPQSIGWLAHLNIRQIF